jgi:hypothetical protein
MFKSGFACIFLNPLFGILGYIIFFGSAGVVIIGIIPGPKHSPGEYGLKHGSFQLSIFRKSMAFR